jgi:hypothetical protein
MGKPIRKRRSKADVQRIQELRRSNASGNHQRAPRYTNKDVAILEFIEPDYEGTNE